jgi:uncharacterized membrane protein
MHNFLLSFLSAAIIMGIIDAVWLSVVASTFYKSQIGNLLLAKPRMVPAVVFYVIYIIGITVFVVTPALAQHSLGYAATYGALFGFVAYATYDLTNLSTLKGFTNKLVVVDLLWGTVLTMVVSTLTYVVVSTL